jgi:hypothetical protein
MALQMPPPEGVTWDALQNCWRNAAGHPIESPADAIVQAQIDGEPIFEMTTKEEISFMPEPDESAEDMANIILSRVRRLASLASNAEKGPMETNGAGFYVDGYTLASTTNVGEIAVRRMDSDKVVILKSSQLTGFLDRRFED